MKYRLPAFLEAPLIVNFETTFSFTSLYFFLHLCVSVKQYIVLGYYVFKFIFMIYSMYARVSFYIFVCFEEMFMLITYKYMFYSFCCFVVSCLIPQFIYSFFDAYLDFCRFFHCYKNVAANICLQFFVFTCGRFSKECFWNWSGRSSCVACSLKGLSSFSLPPACKKMLFLHVLSKRLQYLVRKICKVGFFKVHSRGLYCCLIL